MKKLVCWILLGYLISLCLFPIVITAATSDLITITATGSNVTVSSIENFAVVTSDIDNDEGWIKTNGNWDNPDTLDGVIVVRNFSDYPATVDDGVVVYDGTLEEFEETIIGDSIQDVYYTAWAYVGEDYSLPSYYLLEVEDTMTNAIMLGVFVLMALGASIACLVSPRSKEFLAIISGFGWLILGIWSYSQHEEVWDIYYSIAFFSLWMVLLFVLIGAGMYTTYRKNKKGEWVAKENWGEDEDLRLMMEEDKADTERMDRLFGNTKRKRKPRATKSKFDLTGEI